MLVPSPMIAPSSITADMCLFMLTDFFRFSKVFFAKLCGLASLRFKPLLTDFSDFHRLFDTAVSFECLLSFEPLWFKSYTVSMKLRSTLLKIIAPNNNVAKMNIPEYIKCSASKLPLPNNAYLNASTIGVSGLAVINHS